MTVYREKSSGADVELEILEMDANRAVFKRQGRAPELVERKQFDDAFELKLPPVNPLPIESIATVPRDKPNPLGPAIPSTPQPDVDALGRMFRNLTTDLDELRDLVLGMAGKVDAIHKVVAEPAAPDKPAT